MSNPLDPRTYTDTDLQSMLRTVAKLEEGGKACDCMTCSSFNKLVRDEAVRRGMTGQPS